jgi:HEPN domain-containing protein
MKEKNRAADWLRQAQSDMRYARAAFRDGFHAQVCFICQQAAEKAVKSILYARGAKVILSHSIHRLCEEARINDELQKAARVLDQYYITARYPDALAEGTPEDVFTDEQSANALEKAEAFVRLAEEIVS